MTLCSLHGDIAKEAGKLLFGKVKKDVDVETLSNDIDSIGTEIIRLVDEATVRGQRMENRLSEYRNAIEGLGFERKK